MTFKTPRAWISPAKYFFPNFEIHLRRFIPSPLLFPFFLFSLFSIKTSKIFLDTRLSLYSSKNSRNSNEADRRTDRKRERERKTTCSCSTWKCTSRLSGPNSPRYFHGTSPFLSVSLRQTLLKPREARSRRIHGGKRSNRAAFSGTRFENSVNWPFLN